MFDYVILGYFDVLAAIIFFVDRIFKEREFHRVQCSNLHVTRTSKFYRRFVSLSLEIELIDRSISETPSEREVTTSTSFDHVNAIYAIKNKSETRGDKNLRAD